MRKLQLLKRILAGSMVLALTVADTIPAMAAEIQPSDSVIEENASEEDLQDEAQKTETSISEAENEIPPADTTIPETETPITETPDAENETPDAETKTGTETLETDSKDDTELIQETTVYTEDNNEVRATAPAISNFRLTPAASSSRTRFHLTYTVANCDRLSLQVTAPNGDVVYSRTYYTSDSGYIWDDDDNEQEYYYDREYWIDSDSFNYSITSGTVYTFTLTPSSTVWDDVEEDDVTVTGTPATATWTAPRPVTVTGLAVKEMTPSGIHFSHGAVPVGTSVYYEYSANKAFDQKLADVNSTSSDYISYESLTPETTYYVRAYTYAFGTKGGYSNVTTVKAPVAEVTDISTEIFDKDISLNMSASYGDYTGFEVSRKIGKKYQVIATTTAHTYKDAGLKTDTQYTYRVRAYYYNSDTKKNVYGIYEYKTVQTGVAALNLKAQAAGKNSIKLSWKKIPGAAGYDIYRNVGNSSSSTYKSGENYNFSKYELVKSLNKKKTSFTDKKLLAGAAYGYRVRAYKLVKKQKVYFTEGAASASAKFSFSTSVNVYKEAQNPKNGTVAIAWYPIPDAKGYLIEKYDGAKEEWVTQKKITKAKTTKYTLPAAPLGQSVRYRIRAYKGNKYSGQDNVYVEGHIAAVTGVKAQASSTGVKISWKAVPGASYYKVYRTADLGSVYDADTKTYGYNGESNVNITVFKQASITDNYYYTLNGSTVKMEMDSETAQKLAYRRPDSASTWADTSNIVGTSVTDYAYSSHRPVYDENGKAFKEDVTLYGPRGNVTYQYYVVAYRDVKNADGSWTTGNSFGASKSATAAISDAPLKAPSIKAKAGKKSATISYKKIKGAKKYLIYRSNSKKGAYELVGISTKTSYKDTGLTKKKSYYYKVKAVAQNSLGADKYSSFSKVKSVKAK